jgi:hypothetical protein
MKTDVNDVRQRKCIKYLFLGILIYSICNNILLFIPGFIRLLSKTL